MAAQTGSLLPPRLLRALVTWPPEDFRRLERALKIPIAERRLGLNRALPDGLENQLQTAGYYHILVIDPLNFAELPDEQRQRLLGKVNLAILAPGAVERSQIEGLLAGAAAGIARQASLTGEQAVGWLAGLLDRLGEQMPLIDAVGLAWGATGIADPPPWILLSRQDAAIWPPGPASQDTTRKPASKRTLSASNQSGQQIPAVLIQNANFTTINQVNGNQVNIQRGGTSPESVSNQVTGDQLNVQRFNGAPVSIQQSAGGDQVNINRIAGEARAEISQDAGKDQVNINRISGSPISTSAQPAKDSSHINFLIITALPEEREALLSKLPGAWQIPPTDEDTHTYTRAELPVKLDDGLPGKYHLVVLTLAGIGRVQAGTTAAQAVHRWHPDYVILVGIAGGFATGHVSIGDVLVADQIVDYEIQTLLPDDPEMRLQVFRADPRLLEACNSLGDAWKELIQVLRPAPGEPRVRIGPIASGDKVIAYSKVVDQLRNRWPKLLGVEMEAGGVAAAAFQSPEKPGFFMVRGVADLSDENKYTDQVKKWRSYACDVAAAYAISLLKSARVPLVDLESGAGR